MTPLLGLSAPNPDQEAEPPGPAVWEVACILSQATFPCCMEEAIPKGPLVERGLDSSECEKTEGLGYPRQRGWLVHSNDPTVFFRKRLLCLPCAPARASTAVAHVSQAAPSALWDHPRSMGDVCFPAFGCAPCRGTENGTDQVGRKKVANATGVWLFPLEHVEQEAITKTNPSGAPAPPPFQQGRQIALHGR